jgi:hypothetical protein
MTNLHDTPTPHKNTHMLLCVGVLRKQVAVLAVV